MPEASKTSLEQNAVKDNVPSQIRLLESPHCQLHHSFMFARSATMTEPIGKVLEGVFGEADSSPRYLIPARIILL